MFDLFPKCERLHGAFRRGLGRFLDLLGQLDSRLLGNFAADRPVNTGTDNQSHHSQNRHAAGINYSPETALRQDCEESQVGKQHPTRGRNRNGTRYAQGGRASRIGIVVRHAAQARQRPRRGQHEGDNHHTDDVPKWPHRAVTQQRQQKQHHADAVGNDDGPNQDEVALVILQQLKEEQEIPLGPGRVLFLRIGRGVEVGPAAFLAGVGDLVIKRDRPRLLRGSWAAFAHCLDRRKPPRRAARRISRGRPTGP